MLESEEDIPIEYTPKTRKMSCISDKHSHGLLGKKHLNSGATREPERLGYFDKNYNANFHRTYVKTFENYLALEPGGT